MRLLVASDSHGNTDTLRRIVAPQGAAQGTPCGAAQPSAAALLFLGDGARDAEAVLAATPDAPPLFAVRGNNDFGVDWPLSRLEIFGDKRIFMTHGHAYAVKRGADALLAAARGARADVVLFGHTHASYKGYEDGLYICNPGYARRGEYAVLDITKAGVVCLLRKL